MKKFRRRKRGEMIAMVLASVFVLGALTVTGVYIKNRNTVKGDDGYYIDFDALEAEMNEKLKQAELNNASDDKNQAENTEEVKQNTEAVQSGSIEKENEVTINEQLDTQILEDVIVEEPEDTETVTTDNIIEDQSVINNVPTLSFSKEDSLIWPVSGSVIINYSMDSSVYFETLDQYKYNPAMIISAVEGELVTAAADGIVTEIYEDNELGKIVELDIGDGYHLVYGQMGDIVVGVGQYITVGEVLGHVGLPTKYYSAEGCNVYFKLTKDDKPENPMNYLE